MLRLSQKDKELFKVLVVYWQNHIDAHNKDYQRWIDKIEESKPEVHLNLIRAQEYYLKSQEYLMKAKILFNQGEEKESEEDY